MRTSFIIAFLLSLTLVSALPYELDYYDGQQNQGVNLGNNAISFNNVQFTCTDQPSLIAPPPTRQAPKGAFEQSCTCDVYYYDRPTVCQKNSCQITKDIQKDNSCWVGTVNFLGSQSLYYSEPKVVSPFIIMSYTTNAEYGHYLNPTLTPPDTVGVRKGYLAKLMIDVDVANGLNTSINLGGFIDSNNRNIQIQYNNKILPNLKGGIEIKEANFIFLPSSTISDIPVTFNQGTGSVPYTMSDITGDKDIIITPYILINNQKFVGEEHTYSTKVFRDRSLANTVPYFASQANTGDKLSGWFSSVIKYINSLFT